MKTKLIVDAISLLSPLTGIGRYTYEISKILKDEKELEISFFYGYFSKKLQKPYQKSNIKSIKTIIIKIPFIKKIARKFLVLFSDIFSPTYDLYWQPNFIPNSGIKAKKIVTTVHDFSFLLYSEFQPKETSQHFKNNFFKNIYASDIIITGSEYTKQEILQKLDFDKDKIKVIPHGLNHDIFKIHEETKLDFDIPDKFILSVGSIEPRKNLINLLKAYSLLDTDIKQEYKLVLVGFKGWQNKEIVKLIDENKKNIHYLGFISDEELAKVYNRASIFTFASFYEGFGLPILEAMACGTPVISSNTTSMPEVGADAVKYFTPDNIQEITNTISLVLKDKNLQNEMIKKGLQRVKMFSWQTSANEHNKIFNNLTKEINEA